MSTLAHFLRRVWSELPVYIFASICGAACLAIYAHFHRVFPLSEAAVSFNIFALTAMVMWFVDIVGQLLVKRPAHPLSWARDRYLSQAAFDAALCGAPAMLLCILIIPLFSSFKAMIPLFTPYRWDATLIAVDRFLFFGRDAWEALQPIMGHPPVTAFMAVVYSSWGLLLYAGCMVVAFFQVVPTELKRRFFLAYAMAWSLLGGVMATLFASVGPVFDKTLIGIDHFGKQLRYIDYANSQIPVLTVPVQKLLLARFAVDSSDLGSGISAMPSMHVAIAALFWLTMREVGPRAGRVFGGYLFLIWIGSFRLGYHYACDGIVSMGSMVAIWWGVKRLFSAWDRIDPPRLAQPTFFTNTVPAE